MNFKEFTDHCKLKIKENPLHREGILDVFELCFDEIENHESEEHEIELAIEAIEQLISTPVKTI